MVGLGRTLVPRASAFADPSTRAVDAKDDPQSWDAVLARDPGARFVYAVASTGVYCRPSCPSRRPLQKNVVFFATPCAAELAGYRACKRCLPDEESRELRPAVTEPVLVMCRRLEGSAAAPSLAELSRHVGLSPYQAHRCFVKALGLTPKQYRHAIERRRAEEALAGSDSVTQAIYGAGVGSAARFYQRLAPGLGMRPAQVKEGGRGVSIRYAIGSSALGYVLVAATARGVCAVSLGDSREELVEGLSSRFSGAEIRARAKDLQGSLRRVVELVEGQTGGPADLPLDIRGTAFQERGWRALRRIRPGATQTYAEVAVAIGAPQAVRAVAHACAQNPLAVLVPCHRVVRKGGALAGYRWGLERKRALLERERAADAPRKARRLKAERGRAARKR